MSDIKENRIQNSEDIVELCKAHNTMQFEAIAEVLEDNNIPFTYSRKGLSLGTFFEYSSKKSYIQVSVYKEDKGRAFELIEPILMTL